MSPSAPGLFHSPSCSNNFAVGSSVTLTAAPATGSTLTGWSGGGCSGAGSCVVTMDVAKTVTASFTLNSYTVNPSIGSGVGNGSISPAAAQTVSYGASTAFTISPNSGYVVSIGGSCSGSIAGLTYTAGPVTANCAVVVNFVALSPTTTLASSKNPSNVGQPVTFTATVAGTGASPTGTVVFKDGAATISGCEAAPILAGVAVCTTVALAQGAHIVTAQYLGNATYAISTSGAVSQTVNQDSTALIVIINFLLG